MFAASDYSASKMHPVRPVSGYSPTFETRKASEQLVRTTNASARPAKPFSWEINNVETYYPSNQCSFQAFRKKQANRDQGNINISV